MRNLFSVLVAGVIVLGLGSAQASAQETAPVAAEPAAAEPAPAAEEAPKLEAQVEYTEPSGAKPSYDDYRREELEKKAKRSRNALIGTSVATVVGLPLWLAGSATQCYKYIDSSGSEQVTCSTGGKVMRGIGIPLAMGGVTGVLISGIMLGVRKGKLRDIEKRTKYSSSKRLHWDPFSSQFVF
jgi:hypothetical protein